MTHERLSAASVEATQLADKIASWSPSAKGPLVFIARERRLIEDALRSHDPAQGPLKLGDMVQFNESAPYASEWRGAKLKVVSLRAAPDGSIWVSVIEPEDSMAHRGHGVYDGETTDIPAEHLSPISSTQGEAGK